MEPPPPAAGAEGACHVAGFPGASPQKLYRSPIMALWLS